MWANITYKGGLNTLHTHPGNLWAAVLCIDSGVKSEQASRGGDSGGNLYLEDPRFPIAAMRDPSFRLLGADGQPQKYQIYLRLKRGDLVVFPAWLCHGVRPYAGYRERLSVALNIDVRRGPR